MCACQVGYGFAQSGFNGPWRIAKLPPRSFRREGCRSQCDPDGLCRGGRGGARYVIGHELHYSSSHLGKLPRNGNAKAIAAADRGHILEKLFERNTFATENIPLADLSAFHGEDQARCDVAHVDEIQNEIEIKLKTLA